MKDELKEFVWVDQNIWTNVTKKSNGKGIQILGVKFFPDDLQTTNYNWSNRVEELRIFVERNKTRKVSPGDKILLLNINGMATFCLFNAHLFLIDFQFIFTHAIIYFKKM